MANTRTVGTGKDHATVADALAWFQTAAGNHEFGVDGIGTISIEESTGFAEDIDIDDLNYNGGAPTSTSYLKITVPSANRHAGLWSDSKAHMDSTNPSQNAVIHINEDYTMIEYLQVALQSGAGNSDECIRVESGVTGALVSRCIIKDDSGAGNSTDGVYSGGWACDYSVDNCIIYGFQRAGIHAQNFSGNAVTTVNVDHCSIFDCGQDGSSNEDGGLSGTAQSGETTNINVYNTACLNNTTISAQDFADGATAGTLTWTGTHNASSDASLTARGISTNAQESLTLQDTAQVSGNNFIVQEKDSPNFDFQLNTTSFNNAVANGTDRQGSEPDSRQDFSTDIAGNARGTTDVDIGASQISSAGGAFTLTADSGSYTYTGTAADVQADFVLSAITGAYAYTGTAADLNYGFLLTADSGSYVYTGTDAELDAAFALAADSGTYTYSGTAADLNRGYYLAGDTGAYTYTGADATLTFASAGNFTLSADSGSYTYTGTDAVLAAGLVMAADTASYAYTGTAATLARGYPLPAISGSYAYTGTDVGLDYDSVNILSADAGAYAYTGFSATLSSTGGALWTVQGNDNSLWTTQSNNSTTWTVQ